MPVRDTHAAEFFENNLAHATPSNGRGDCPVDDLFGAEDSRQGRFVIDAVLQAEDRGHLGRQGAQGFEGGRGIVRFQGKERHVEAGLGQRFSEGGGKFNGRRGHGEAALRPAARIEAQVESQPSRAERLNHRGLFHKNDVVPGQGQRSTEIGANRTRAKR